MEGHRSIREYGAETILAQGGGAGHMTGGGSAGGVVAPIHLATTQIRAATPADTASNWAYGRYDHPGLQEPQQVLKLLEGGADCLLFNSGMAAMTAVILALRPGDHAIFPRDMYHGLRSWLGDFAISWGLRIEHVDLRDLAAVQAAVRPGATKLIWAETPSNPHWWIYDLAGLAQIAHRADARLVVDNTVATPILTRPLCLGADLVVHSATKYLNGHSDVLAGAAITARTDDFWARVDFNRGYTGGILNGFQSSMLMRGMRTLHLRVARASETAQTLADWLRTHPRVKRVLYPGLADHPGHALAARQMSGGFGGMLSFVLDGDAAAADAVAARTRLWKSATSLGGVESLIERRHLVEGDASGVDPALLRLSVGIEAAADLIDDLADALA